MIDVISQGVTPPKSQRRLETRRPAAARRFILLSLRHDRAALPYDRAAMLDDDRLRSRLIPNLGLDRTYPPGVATDRRLIGP
jgi:hypothetical protein